MKVGLCREGERVVSHRCNDREGLNTNSALAEITSPTLKAFLNTNGGTDKSRGCLFDDIDQSFKCFAVGKKIINEKDDIIGRDTRRH